MQARVQAAASAITAAATCYYYVPRAHFGALYRDRFMHVRCPFLWMSAQPTTRACTIVSRHPTRPIYACWSLQCREGMEVSIYVHSHMHRGGGLL